MNYSSAVAYLDSLVNYERLPNQQGLRERRLERMHSLLDALGNPHERLRIIHVAGTKGKGSVCAMLYTVLRRCDVAVGLYTSPHLEDLRERIRVTPPEGIADWISEGALAEGIARVRSAIDATTLAGGPVTYFEALTAVALDYFARRGARWAILEVGLGGRLDATNATQPPVAAITPISLDHTEALGTTVETIAVEKAGIIKPGQTVVSAPQVLPAESVVRAACARAGARLIQCGNDVTVDDVLVSRAGTRCTITGRCGRYADLQLPLLGRHQADNAAVAVATLEALRGVDATVPWTPAMLRDGLARTDWPGRGEWIPASPPLLFDGAHNGASADALRQLVQDLLPLEARIGVVLGMSQGKDVGGVARALAPLAPEVWATQADHPRSLPAHALASRLQPWLPMTHAVPHWREALQHAQRAGCDVIVVTGSLFLVGQARQHVAALA